MNWQRRVRMRQLSRIQTAVMLVGAILMAVGAGCCAFLWHPEIFSWVFLAGTLAFVLMQWQQRYEGDNMTIRRLRKIMVASGGFFILAGVSMVDTHYHFIGRFMSWHTYITFFYNKWVMLVLAGAFLQLYSSHRISNELQKD